MKVISIYNNKGGVGKTTTTKMLSKYLQKSCKSVLLIDMDPQGNLSSQFKINNQIEKTINDVLINKNTSIEEAIYKIDTNISIVPSNLKLLNANNQMLVESYNIQPTTRLFNKISELKKSNLYDFCLIDCPPTMDLLVTNALVVTDEVIIPLKVDSYSIDGIKMLLEKIGEVKNNYNDELKISSIFLNATKNSKTTEEFHNKLLEFIPEMAKTRIGDYIAINKDTFIPSSIELEKHKVMIQYQELFSEMGLI